MKKAQRILPIFIACTLVLLPNITYATWYSTLGQKIRCFFGSDHCIRHANYLIEPVSPEKMLAQLPAIPAEPAAIENVLPPLPEVAGWTSEPSVIARASTPVSYVPTVVTPYYVTRAEFDAALAALRQSAGTGSYVTHDALRRQLDRIVERSSDRAGDVRDDLEEEIETIDLTNLSNVTLSGTTTGSIGTFTQLGIATTSPTDTLALNGAFYIASIAAPSATNNRLYNLDGELYWNGDAVGSGSGSGNVATGTPGQLPFYQSEGTSLTATSTLFISSASNVGIGTTSPYAKLSVGGQVVASHFTGTTTDNSTFMGAVGIGTTNPGAELDIKNKLIFDTDSSANIHSVRTGTSDGSDNQSIVLSASGHTGSAARGGYFAVRGNEYDAAGQKGAVLFVAGNSYTSSTDGAIRFLTGNEEDRMVISYTGNVGIGTTSPYAKLAVSGQVVGEYFTATSTAQTSTFAGGISSPGTGSQSEKFGSGASATGQYNLAIGNTASAADTNSVAIGALSTASNGGFAFGRGASATAANSMSFGVNSSNSGINSISIGNSNAITTNNTIAIGVGAGGAGTSIAIGTGAQTTAANQFVAGTSGGSGMYISNVFFGNGVSASSPVAYTINGTGGSGTNIAGANISLAGGKGTGNAAGGDILFDTSDAGSSGTTAQSLTTKMIVKASGNVGVGTTSPYSKLSVAGQVAAQNFIATSSASNNYFAGKLSVGTTDASALLNVGTYNTSFYTMRTGGFVIQPYSLNNGFMADNAYFDGGSFVRINPGYASLFQFYQGQLLIENAGSGTGSFTQKTTFKTDSAGAVALGGTISVNNGEYTGALMVVRESGNVGIASTSPIAKLSVEGNIAANGSITTYSEGDIFKQYDASSANAYPILARYWDNNSSFQSGTYLFGNGTNSRVGVEKPGSAQIAHFQVRAVKATYDGRVGIGTTSPSTDLTVVGDAFIDQQPNFPGTSTISLAIGDNDTGFNWASDGNLAFWSDNQERMRLKSDKFGIGTTDPQQRLHVQRSDDGSPIRIEDSNGYCELNPTSTTWSCTSDERLKKNIKGLDNPDLLEYFMQLRPVTYNWKKEQSGDPTHTGFIAQDVEELFPDLVVTDGTTGLKSVAYSGFIPYIIEVLQDVVERIRDLEDRLSEKVESMLVRTQKVETQELCLDDVCITKEELKELLEENNDKPHEEPDDDPEPDNPEPDNPDDPEPDPEPTDPTPDEPKEIEEETIEATEEVAEVTEVLESAAEVVHPEPTNPI